MIGKVTHNVDVSYEYTRLAKEDERVGLLLKEKGEYRHSMYFLIQAMEKYVRAKTFSIVNPLIPYFREKERNHSLEAAIQSLLEVINSNKLVQDQIRTQMQRFVLGDIDFRHLHNNLRYPYYSGRNNYSSVQFEKRDNEIIAQKLEALKSFIAGIDRFK